MFLYIDFQNLYVLNDYKILDLLMDFSMDNQLYMLKLNFLNMEC